MLQKFIILMIIVVIMALIGVFFVFNDIKSEDKSDNEIIELTLKQIYNSFLNTWNLLYNMEFDKIHNMNMDLLLYIKTNLITFEKIDQIIYHEITRGDNDIVVKFYVRLITGQYAITEWVFNKHKEHIKNIDNLIRSK